MLAHKRGSDKEEQSVTAHCRNVAKLCSWSMARIGFEKLGYLTGLLHDLGKCSRRWQVYFLESYAAKADARHEVMYHAPAGAVFAYERWYSGGFSERAAAQLLVMAIYGHHSGLMDAFDIDGSSPLLEKMEQGREEQDYSEAAAAFLCEVVTEEELDGLFREAAAELEAKRRALNLFSAGLLLRFLLGALVDADRWDSACFEYGENPLKAAKAANWARASEALRRRLAEFPSETALAELRAETAKACLTAAVRKPGIYSLTVPTGGGKTFASLGFALRHALINGQDRIFYVIPFNTILDQNGQDIREALGVAVDILEHHSNVVFDEDEYETERVNYKRLTERWQSDIILTSMVQFLNAFYSRSNTDARRLGALANSVIIFDEIQALPKRCVRLFEKAVGFLTDFYGCTVVLCTATQPQLKLKVTELVPDTERLYKALRRTRLIDESGISRSTEQAAADVLRLIKKHGSVLMIVNTKRMARRIYELVRQSGIDCVHLSTDMYAEHRLRLIQRIKNRPEGRPFFCVSTALIEAGINISFPCVIRSLTGLGSAIQAAGRCNRNAELGEGRLGEVYIWSLQEESLKRLPEITRSQDCMRGYLAARHGEIDSPEGIAAYYAIERKAFEAELPYPERARGVEVTLLDILGDNGHIGAENRRKLALCGAYRTAEELFKVIPDETVPVLIERDEGAEIATELAGEPPFERRLWLLRRAQQYSVNVYAAVFATLLREGAVRRLEDCGIYVLRGEYYDPATGLTMNTQLMDDLFY